MAPVLPSIRAFEKPIHGRSFLRPWALVALLLPGILGIAGVGTARAAPPLTAEVAVEQALARPERQAVRAATLDAARSEARAARAAGANPQITWQEERRGEGAPATTDYFWLTQGLGGLTTGPARRQEARATLAGAEALAALEEREVAAEVRRAFYGALWHQARRAQAQAWLDRLSRAAKATATRQEAGDASRWELERLALEVERAQAVISREEARMAEAWAALSIFTGASPVELAPLAGPLEPPPLAFNHRISGIWDAALTADRQAAEARSAQVGRSWLQNANVGGGIISERDPTGGDLGIMITANIPLPLSAQSRAQAAALDAEARRLEAEGIVSATHLDAALAGATGAMERHLAGAAQLAKAEARGRALIDIAEAGWTGGELSLHDVLDAHRAALQTALEGLDAQLAARHAWIEITRLSEGAMP